MSRLSSNILRLLKIDSNQARAVYLVGPRKCGKTTLLRKAFSNAMWIDLLNTDLRTELTLQPHLLRERVLHNRPKTLVIDEIQKVTSLLDEVHWCIENTKTQMVLCSSSARSLKRDVGSILGGRAWRYELFPFTLQEVGISDLSKVMNSGLVPPHYFSPKPDQDLKAYIYDFLEEEIRKESKVRDLPAFSRFLETAALMNGELLNYANVGRECGVSPKTVRAYYEILEETYLGFRLDPWTKVKDRRLVETSKVYFFDVGIVRYLRRITTPLPGSPEYGNFFETLLIHEINAYKHYRQVNVDFTFWKTASGFEVDILIGSLSRIDVAIEFKSSQKISPTHLKGLRALSQEQKVARKILVCSEKLPRTTEDKIEILPFLTFIKMLWAGDIF